MPVTYIGRSTMGNTQTTNMDLTSGGSPPAWQAGDLAIAVITFGSTSVSAGWNSLGIDSGGTARHYAAWRILQTGDSGWSVTNNGAQGQWQIHVFRGADPAAPISATTGSLSEFNITFGPFGSFNVGSIDHAGRSGSMQLIAWGQGFTSVTWDTPTGFTLSDTSASSLNGARRTPPDPTGATTISGNAGVTGGAGGWYQSVVIQPPLTAPTISATSPADGATLASIPTLQTSVTDPDAETVYVEYQWSQSATFASGVTTQNTAAQTGPLSGAAFTRTPTGLGTGTWYWRARAIDAAGLASGYTTTRSFSLQLSPRTFAYTGAEQTFVVPSGVTSIQMECWGAESGMNGYSGLGGYAKGVIAVTPGETLRINVGGKGGDGGSTANGAPEPGSNGGWNGGGAAGRTKRAYWSVGAGGGGASDVRRGGSALANRVMIGGGGGGGGAGTGNVGGTGGGTTGSTPAYVVPPSTSSTGETSGGGGTQSAGGAAGVNGTPMPPHWMTPSAGALATGGQGGGQDDSGGQYAGGSGGGGGGGYYGGGGGGYRADYGYAAGGGGGSGYATGTQQVLTNGLRSGHGQVVLTYATANTAPSAPTLTSPADRAPMNLLTGQFQWQFNDPDPGDAQGQFAFRRRAWGAVGVYEWWNGSAWQGTEVFINGAFNYVNIPVWGASDDTYHWSVATRDIAGNTSPYATERLVNPWEWWNGSAWVTAETFITNATSSAQVPVANHANGDYKWSVATKDAALATGPYSPENKFTFGTGQIFERFGSNFI